MIVRIKYTNKLSHILTNHMQMDPTALSDNTQAE